MRKISIAAAALAAIALPAALPGADRAAAPRFQAGQGGEYEFDTGVLAGKLREGGKSLGLSSMVYQPAGLNMAQRYGIFSYYRVFIGDKRYGGATGAHGAWDWPSEARPGEDGSLETYWPAAPDRPFELRSIYRWAGPDTLDLETRVRAVADLADFEVLLSSYFDLQLTDVLAYARSGGKPAFLAPEPAHGKWQWFPRDRAAADLIRRGRYKIPPSPVDWAIRPELAAPVALRREPKSGVTAVVMAHPAECIGIAMPQVGEPHSSVYLGLFGRTVKAGQEARAFARLRVARSPSEKEIVKMYREYLASLKKRR